MIETAIDFDLGFDTEEFKGNEQTVTYAQFLNPYKSPHWGIAIKKDQAEIAGFKPDNTWKTVEHKFKGSSQPETLYLCKEPRIIVLNRSRLLKCSPEGQVSLYDHSKDQGLSKEWKKYTYLIVWFLGENKQPLSDLPFRLKISGQAGMSFINHYKNYTGQSCFCGEFFKLYKELNPRDKDNSKSDLFYAHTIYKPEMEEKEAKSKYTGESSDVCMTVGFVKPTRKNFLDLVISKKKNPELSDRILEQIENTKYWIDVAQVNKEYADVFDSGSNNSGLSSSVSSTSTISDKQARRLFAICKSNGMEKEDYDRYLRYFDYDFDTDISRGDYEDIVSKVEDGSFKTILEEMNDRVAMDQIPY